MSAAPSTCGLTRKQSRRSIFLTPTSFGTWIGPRTTIVFWNWTRTPSCRLYRDANLARASQTFAQSHRRPQARLLRAVRDGARAALPGGPRAADLGDERGVLLGKRRIDPGRGRWSFPAGYVNRGEVIEEAAVNKVEAELG